MAREINQAIGQCVRYIRGNKEAGGCRFKFTFKYVHCVQCKYCLQQVAEKAAQRENETLDDEGVLPVAADNSADEKRREDAQSKLQAYVESIPNGTFISCLPLVIGNDEGGLSLGIDSDDDSEYNEDNEGDGNELEDDEANACESSGKKISAKVLSVLHRNIVTVPVAKRQASVVGI